MRYREIHPVPSLSRFVECFWTLENDEPLEPAEPERILPDGCVEVILNFGSPFRELREDGRAVTQPGYFVVGQMTRPMLIAANGCVELIGVRFHPGGALPFFAIPMSELTNQVVELDALTGKLNNDLIARVGETKLLTDKVNLLQTLLAKKVNGSTDGSLSDLVTSMMARHGHVSVDELAVEANISNRQLERRFQRDVGLSPKLLCRILRFQQVFRALDQDDANWAVVAADCGYYDQAHLIRDFQQFAGQTPALLLAQASPLTQSFTRKDRMSHFSNTVTAQLK